MRIRSMSGPPVSSTHCSCPPIATAARQLAACSIGKIADLPVRMDGMRALMP